MAIDGSKFKAVNSRDRNFTPAKIEARKKQIEESIQRYLDALDTADRTQPGEFVAKTDRLADKVKTLREQMRRMDRLEVRLQRQAEPQLSLTDPDSRSMMSPAKGTGVIGYNAQVAVDILDIEPSGGLFNTWVYGFDPSELLAKSRDLAL